MEKGAGLLNDSRQDRHTELGHKKVIDEYFNLNNSCFSPIKSLFVFFIIKHTVESEQRIQLLTKYQQIQGRRRRGEMGAEIYNRKITIFQCRKIMFEG